MLRVDTGCDPDCDFSIQDSQIDEHLPEVFVASLLQIVFDHDPAATFFIRRRAGAEVSGTLLLLHGCETHAEKVTAHTGAFPHPRRGVVSLVDKDLPWESRWRAPMLLSFCNPA